MIKHLKKYLGWYILIPSLYLAFSGEGEMWIVILVVMLKMPPFDLVGRYENWLSKGAERKGKELKKKLDKKPKWVRFVYGVFVIILILLWILFAPECELC